MHVHIPQLLSGTVLLLQHAVLASSGALPSPAERVHGPVHMLDPPALQHK